MPTRPKSINKVKIKKKWGKVAESGGKLSIFVTEFKLKRYACVL